jgi:hypothetical protein
VRAGKRILAGLNCLWTAGRPVKKYRNRSPDFSKTGAAARGSSS